MQDRFAPVNAGWKAGRVPFESFFGPAMDLSPTASRFDNSISWLAAIGNEAALSVFDEFGADAIYARNRELAELLRASLAEIGWTPVDLPEANRSTIVSVPLGDAEPAPLLDEAEAATASSARPATAICASRSTSTTTRTTSNRSRACSRGTDPIRGRVSFSARQTMTRVTDSQGDAADHGDRFR